MHGDDLHEDAYFTVSDALSSAARSALSCVWPSASSAARRGGTAEPPRVRRDGTSEQSNGHRERNVKFRTTWDISTFNSPSIRAHIIVVLYPLGEIDCMEILEDFGTNHRRDTKSGASPYGVVDF